MKTSDEIRRVHETFAFGTTSGIPILPVNEGAATLAGGMLSDTGIAITMGSGSFVYGQDIHGMEYHYGGWGPVLGEDPDAFLIGRLALDAILHAADGLADIRIGRNILHLRRAAQVAQGTASDTLNRLLSEVRNLFRLRQREGMAVPPPPAILAALDDAVAAIQTIGHDARRHQALLAAVGMRCNLFPHEQYT